MTLVLVGCDQPSPEAAARQEAASLQYARHVESLPIKPPSGKVTVREIAEIFAKGCLPNFDNVDATLADLKRAGLTTEEKLEWDAGENGLRSDAKGINGSMGLQRFGERSFGIVCSVSAQVSDPNSDPTISLSSLIPELDFDSNGNALIPSGKGNLQIHSRTPRLFDEVPMITEASMERPVQISDLDLTDPNLWKGAYRYWGVVSFSVRWAPK